MEDLVQSAIAETIPELLAEARQEVRTELEHAAVTEASVYHAKDGARRANGPYTSRGTITS